MPRVDGHTSLLALFVSGLSRCPNLVVSIRPYSRALQDIITLGFVRSIGVYDMALVHGQLNVQIRKVGWSRCEVKAIICRMRIALKFFFFLF